MKSRIFFIISVCILLLFQAQLVASDACNGVDTAVRLVTIPSVSSSPSCSETSIKRYSLTFPDITLNLQYSISKGVFLVEMPAAASQLSIKQASATTSSKYQLNGILIRSPAMHSITSVVFDAEMQLYFAETNPTNGLTSLPIVLSVPLQKSTDKSSAFFAKMNPTLVDEPQAVNLYSTLNQDLLQTASILESASAIYQQSVYIWLYSEKPIYLSQMQYEAFVNQWNDPFRIYKFDNLLTTNSQCTTDATVRYPICFESTTHLIRLMLVSSFVFLMLLL